MKEEQRKTLRMQKEQVKTLRKTKAVNHVPKLVSDCIEYLLAHGK
jgi:hypothetical protein